MQKLLRVNLVKKLARNLYENRCARMVIDSRVVKKGDIFVALKGANTHGNDHALQALRLGAALVLADEAHPVAAHRQVIAVPRPDQLMAEIASAMVELSNATFIAVTGSNGKTTTKDLIACTLGTPRHVLRTEGNYNNHLGVPLTISRLKEHHRYAVIEIGTSNPGEIEALTRLVRPHYSVLTAVNAAHLEGFGNIHGVAQEKSAIFSHMRAPAVCLPSVETMKFPAVKKALSGRTVSSFGLMEGDVHAGTCQLRNDRVQWTVRGQKFMLDTPAMHNIHNANAAIALGLALGLPLEKLAARLQDWNPEKHRMCMLNWKKRRIIDDCYNANPVSVMSAVQTALNLKHHGRQRVIAAVGDMKELGRRSTSIHRNLGRDMAELGIDVLVTMGDQARSALVTFDRAGGGCSRHCKDPADMATFLKEISRPHDIILIKGSRGMRMERIINHITP